MSDKSSDTATKKAAAKKAAKQAAKASEETADRNQGQRIEDLERAETKRAFQEERAKNLEEPAETAMRGGDKRAVGTEGTPEKKATKTSTKKKKRIEAEYVPPSEDVLQRRAFMRLVGWGGLGAYLTFLAGLATRFFWPRVLFEPPTSFVAGFPSEFAIGEVNTAFQNSYRVWMVREVTGMFALIAKCTHLGCTPVWLEAKNKFKCPCHGSGFTKSGINFEGPAPRPLERATIKLLPDGRVFVDKAKVFRQERGEWSKPGASVLV